jgi:hypothetical protein
MPRINLVPLAAQCKAKQASQRGAWVEYAVEWNAQESFDTTMSHTCHADYTKGRTIKYGYFASSLIGYSIGLLACIYVNLDTAQPALVFLVPFTLWPIMVLAR